MPLVSVIVTAYNSLEYIETCIGSVLSQDMQDYDLLVIDDGSNSRDAGLVVDKINEIKNTNIKYLYQDNAGPAAARNRGMHETDSEYVAFLDADDMYCPCKLSLQIDILSKTSDTYAFVSGGREVFKQNRPVKITHKLPSLINGYAYLDLCSGRANISGTPGHLFRRSALESVSGFDERLRNNEDLDLLVRLARRYQIRTHRDVVFRQRKRADSLSNADPVACLHESMKFIDKLSHDDPHIPGEILNLRRQQAYFWNARKLLDMGELDMYIQLVNECVERYGLPRSYRSKLVYALSRGGKFTQMAYVYMARHLAGNR
jgi:glycosyltransferase involved in cell wall biosynthesis